VRAGRQRLPQRGAPPHGTGPESVEPVASSVAARAQAGGPDGGGGAIVGAVSRMNRSSAATTAAASSGEAPGATMRSCGRRFTQGTLARGWSLVGPVAP
jgi:hypothetical protein